MVLLDLGIQSFYASSATVAKPMHLLADGANKWLFTA
jgi:hypothetical protein